MDWILHLLSAALGALTMGVLMHNRITERLARVEVLISGIQKNFDDLHRMVQSVLDNGTKVLEQNIKLTATAEALIGELHAQKMQRQDERR